MSISTAVPNTHHQMSSSNALKMQKHKTSIIENGGIFNPKRSDRIESFDNPNRSRKLNIVLPPSSNSNTSKKSETTSAVANPSTRGGASNTTTMMMMTSVNNASNSNHGIGNSHGNNNTTANNSGKQVVLVVGGGGKKSITSTTTTTATTTINQTGVSNNTVRRTSKNFLSSNMNETESSNNKQQQQQPDKAARPSKFGLTPIENPTSADEKSQFVSTKSTSSIQNANNDTNNSRSDPVNYYLYLFTDLLDLFYNFKFNFLRWMGLRKVLKEVIVLLVEIQSQFSADLWLTRSPMPKTQLKHCVPLSIRVSTQA